jgi:hypothetical protein
VELEKEDLEEVMVTKKGEVGSKFWSLKREMII